jgi:hypothetical protein
MMRASHFRSATDHLGMQQSSREETHHLRFWHTVVNAAMSVVAPLSEG